ncbi:MAG: hypothetical protein E7049_00390 [Lentisphaerae bacterium]|jgi:uncharacterized repeat protein (TIGR02543 family)|nr:hypothetical protein [Lentisphaerota bacterium]
MKKALAFLLTALAVLSASANVQYLNLQYRIGLGGISDNDGRLHASLSVDAKPYVADSSNTYLTNRIYAVIPDGQQFTKWWYYYKTSNTAVTTNSNWVSASTNCVWVYDSKIYSASWETDRAVRIVADFDYITYSLNYNGNGSTAGSMSPESHVYTNKFNLAENAFAKTGYTFVGWTNSVVTTALSDAAQITSGKKFGVTYTNKTSTLYADWKANSYSVRFNKNADDATGSMDDQQFTYDVAQNLADNAFTRNGYVFGGWTNSTGTAYADGASVSNLAADEGAVVDLFAKWTHMWTITFKEADQFGGETLSSATYEDNATVTPPSNPQHDGWNSAGWRDEAGNNFSSTATKDTTYEAQYTAKTYSLTYHANHGEDTKFSTSYTYGTAVSIPKTMQGITSRTGYTLLGWAYDSAATSPDYEPGESGVMFTTAGAVNLYAVWSPVNYTIVFDGSGATSGSVDSINAVYDVEYTIPENGYEKDGLDFRRWRLGTSSDAYYPGNTVSNLTTTANATVTFYAVWSEPRYIAFNGNGATATNGVVEVVEFEGIETKTLPENVFEKTGYTFYGWATNAVEAAALTRRFADGAEVSSADLAGAIGETNEFFAVWNTNAYTVVFNPNCRRYTGEMANMELFYDHETNLTANAFVNESGLHFSGWSNIVTGVTYTDEATISNLTAEANGTVTLNAIWDNGELSKAMHCGNLYWEDTTEYPTAVWTPTFQNGIGCDSDSAAVSPEILSYMVATVRTNGVLRFRWKVGGTVGPTIFKYTGSYNASMVEQIKLTSDDDDSVWHDTGDCEIPDTWLEADGTLTIGIRFTGRAENLTCFIDQLTWTPANASVEPTEDDKPIITGFTPTTSGESKGFAISISNASDDFNYQILGTDDLTTTEEWPVIETLSGSEMNEGYVIEFDEGEPQMFYKVKVIAK